MKKGKNNRAEVARILQLNPEIIKITKYISKAVKIGQITTLKEVFTKPLPKHGAKVVSMFDYGNCLA